MIEAMTVMGVLAGLLAALSLIALVGWSAVIHHPGLARHAVRRRLWPRQILARVLLTVAAVSAGACLLVLAAASFAEHL